MTMTTKEIYNAINNLICLSPSAQYALMDYLKELDGGTITNNITDNEDMNGGGEYDF